MHVPIRIHARDLVKPLPFQVEWPHLAPGWRPAEKMTYNYKHRINIICASQIIFVGFLDLRNVLCFRQAHPQLSTGSCSATPLGNSRRGGRQGSRRGVLWTPTTVWTMGADRDCMAAASYLCPIRATINGTQERVILREKDGLAPSLEWRFGHASAEAASVTFRPKQYQHYRRK